MWWRWFLSTPKSINPVIDETGDFASVNQPKDNVWFLAGKLGDELPNYPARSCRISSTHSILFPVINCEVNFLECPELRTNAELKERVSSDENTITFKECHLDGKFVPVQRVRSEPEVFEVEIDKDNAYNIRGGGITSAVSDGYWIFLKPLSIGQHFIHFRGSCENGKLTSGADYHLQIG